MSNPRLISEEKLLELLKKEISWQDTTNVPAEKKRILKKTSKGYTDYEAATSLLELCEIAAQHKSTRAPDREVPNSLHNLQVIINQEKYIPLRMAMFCNPDDGKQKISIDQLLGYAANCPKASGSQRLSTRAVGDNLLINARNQFRFQGGFREQLGFLFKRKESQKTEARQRRAVQGEVRGELQLSLRESDAEDRDGMPLSSPNGSFFTPEEPDAGVGETPGLEQAQVGSSRGLSS